MAKKGKPYTLKAVEKDDYSFEFTSGRHKLLMSKTMKSDAMPVTWFSPVDMMFAGITGCLGMTIRAFMEEKEIPFSDLRIELEGYIPPESELSAFGTIKTKVYMKTDASPEVIHAIVEESEADCTVRSTMDHKPTFETEVVIEK